MRNDSVWISANLYRSYDMEDDVDINFWPRRTVGCGLRLICLCCCAMVCKVHLILRDVCRSVRIG
jgi:hypothetical protein